MFPLFQEDSKYMFPWAILRATSHTLCLWEATHYTVVCPKLLHIPAAVGAWPKAGFPWKPMALLCSPGQCYSKETLLTPALWAVLTPASEVEVSTGFVWFSPKQTLTDFLKAPGQEAALSLSLRERFSGLWEALLHFPYSSEFQAVHGTLHPPVPSALSDPAPKCCITQSKTLHFSRWLQQGWGFSLPFKVLS